MTIYIISYKGLDGRPHYIKKSSTTTNPISAKTFDTADIAKEWWAKHSSDFPAVPSVSVVEVFYTVRFV